MHKSFIIALSLAFAFSFMTSIVLAAGSDTCQPVFGGGPSCLQSNQITISKQVLNPQTQNFVSNLGPNDPTFSLQDPISFKITVTNNLSIPLSNIKVLDRFPKLVDFVSGQGNFDKNTHLLSFTIDTIKAKSSRDFVLQSKIVATSSQQSITCVVNQVSAFVNQVTSIGNSQFCINNNQPANTSNDSPTTTKGGLPIYPPTKATKTPGTGPETLSLFALIPMAAAGFFLRRKSK
jgi:uncharacterized repeat protein (TIGR01451 family)